MTDKINHRMAKVGKRKTDTGTWPVVQGAATVRPKFCDKCGGTEQVKYAKKRRMLCVKCDERRSGSDGA